METVKQTSKEYLKTLSILHLALTVSPVIFGLVGFYLISIGSILIDSAVLDMVFTYIVPVFIVGGVFGSNWIYKNKLNQLKEENDFNLKMSSFRGALILRYALLEGPALFSVVVAMITSNPLFLVFTGIMVGFMFYWKPTKDTVIADLQLSQQEIIILENPDAIIAEWESVD